MKRNQNGLLHDLTGCGRDADPLASEINNRDKCWNATEHRCSPVADDFINEILDLTTKDNQNGTLCHLKDTDLLLSETNDTAPPQSAEFIVVSANAHAAEDKDSAAKEKQNGFLHHSNSCVRKPDFFESEANSSDEGMNASEYEHSMVVGEFTSTCKSGTQNSLERGSISLELLKKDMDLYTDKQVMEREPEELIVCYKVSTFNVVKDICVDEGVPSKDKILIESSGDDQKGLYAVFPACDENKKSDDIKGNVDTELLVIDKVRPPSCDTDTAEVYLREDAGMESVIKISLQASGGVVKEEAERECLADDPRQVCEANCRSTDKIMDNSSSEDCVSNRQCSAQECGTQKSLESSLLEDCKHDYNNTIENDSGKNSSGKLILEEGDLVVASGGEPHENSPIDNLHYNNKVQCETITSVLDSSKSAAGRRDEGQGTAHLEPYELHDVLRKASEVNDDLLVSSQVQRGEAESSFFAAGPISGLISCSGPISYSGSTSLRSDGSATSTRSFAFPVLQSEWSSSPVRMAKADRRRYQRNRSWKDGLLCCRF